MTASVKHQVSQKLDHSQSNVCQSVVSRSSVQSWCILNGFELVESQPEDGASSEEVEDSFIESNSFRRILEALSAHQWQQMTLKSKIHMC